MIGNKKSKNPEKDTKTENPYISARNEWNSIIKNVNSSRHMWQMFGILTLLITLSAVGGIVHIGSQSKFVPYVVEVDKLGQVLAVAAADVEKTPLQLVVRSTVSEFIYNARIVTPDISLQRKAILRVYSMLSSNDPALQKMNEHLNGSKEKNPFNRATTETVSVEIISVIPQSPETWQVEWNETIRTRQGAFKNKSRMKALVTVYSTQPTSDMTEEQFRANPLNIYVRDFSWSVIP